MGDPNSECECRPLKDLKTVLEWEIPPKENWAQHAESLAERSTFCYLAATDCRAVSGEKYHRKDVPKTLFCHDMKGGYGEDRFVKGCDKQDAYRFLHWSGIDYFVYFSHCFVTIPPLPWINSGHIHGVPVLGTLITEWESGKEIWEEILNSEEVQVKFISKLCQIADFYKFDGYLVNVENKVSPQHAPKLVKCIEMLKKLMDKTKPESFVIWYDSVILPSGEIKYQNKLNSLNKQFFDVCDGIFLNYNWKEKDLELSAVNAGEREKDVFVGVDVWGRGCHGGGGFNCNEAMVLARKYNLSVALFAPAWVHEAQSDADPFIKRDLLFWKIISPHLYLHGPLQLPFKTTFCQGYGTQSYSYGKLTDEKSWFNLTRQNYQPSDLIGYYGCEEPYCLTYCDKEAFYGGGCLLVSKFPYKERDLPHRHRLFVCEFPVDGEIQVRTWAKGLKKESNPELTIVLTVENSSGHSRDIYLQSSKQAEPNDGIDVIKPNISKRLSEAHTWHLRFFVLPLKNCIIREISCMLIGDEPILLGKLNLTPGPSDPNLSSPGSSQKRQRADLPGTYNKRLMLDE